MGLLTTDFKYNSVQTEFQISGAVDLKKLNRSLAEMQAGLATQFAADHIPLSEAAFSRAGDLRYVGQGYELRVPLPDGEITEENAAADVEGVTRGACRRIWPRFRGKPDRDRERPSERRISWTIPSG